MKPRSDASAPIMSLAPLAEGEGLWQLRNELPGRLRIQCKGLIDSPLLRLHARVVLSNCHWLLGFRINRLAGSICIQYPPHRRREVTTLLQEALSLASIEESFEKKIRQHLGTQTIGKTVAHGLTCLALLSLEGVLAIPTMVMTSLSILLLWPLTREVIERLHQRRVTVEALELSFSSLLISQGLSAEALLDLMINDAVEVTQSTANFDHIKLDANHILQRLSETISVILQDSSAGSSVILLKDVEIGMMISIETRQHCFLSARITSGELLVVNRLVDGDWRPRRMACGDLIEPGALVISGKAVARVECCLQSDPAYALLRQHSKQVVESEDGAERWLSRYKRVMPPLLLGAGAAMLSMGSTDQALAAFQFNPVSDWENHKLAARLTTIADLGFHNLRIRDDKALQNLSKIKHLIISRSCLDRIGGIQARELIAQDHDTPHGTLVRLLAGLQNWFCGIDATTIWSRQLDNVDSPIEVADVDVRNLLEGWTITDREGQTWFLRQQPNQTGQTRHTHMNPLEIWQEGALLGIVEMITKPDDHWITTIQHLKQQGITIHLVAEEATERLSEPSTILNIDESNRHGYFDAEQRLTLVQQLQANDESVGYIGYVIHDLPALAQADVSIGLDVDDDSRYLSGLCDLALNTDPLWLPRLVLIGRAMERASKQNLTLLGGSQIASSVAIASGLIAPLQSVLLSDLPLLIAELNNLMALQTPNVMPTPLPVASSIKQASAAAIG